MTAQRSDGWDRALPRRRLAQSPLVAVKDDAGRSGWRRKLLREGIGGPVAIGLCAGKRDEAFAAWHAKNREVATFPNTYVKLGGLGMEMIGFDFFEKSEPLSSQDLEKTSRP